MVSLVTGYSSSSESDEDDDHPIADLNQVSDSEQEEDGQAQAPRLLPTYNISAIPEGGWPAPKPKRTPVKRTKRTKEENTIVRRAMRKGYEAQKQSVNLLAYH